MLQGYACAQPSSGHILKEIRTYSGIFRGPLPKPKDMLSAALVQSLFFAYRPKTGCHTQATKIYNIPSRTNFSQAS
jgi:hypothetical protein